jgi:hypothetical protein
MFGQIDAGFSSSGSGRRSQPALNCSPPRAGLLVRRLPLPRHSTIASSSYEPNATYDSSTPNPSPLPPTQKQQRALVDHMTTDIQNLKSFDPFAEADDTGGETKTSQQNYIHIRIQRMYTPLLTQRESRCICVSFASAFSAVTISRKAEANPAQSAMVAKP